MHRLGGVFNNVNASYKFYWLIAILHQLQRNNTNELSVIELSAQMVSEAWYPVHYFHLFFGKQESLFRAIVEIQKITGLPIDLGKDEIRERLVEISKINKQVRQQLLTLKRYVICRFLTPWLPYESDKDIINASKEYRNNCPYSIIQREGDLYIRFHELWSKYFKENVGILLSFCYWNLSKFMQKHNPNVPNINYKLNKPEERGNLSKQREYWNYVIKENDITCVFSGNRLIADEFEVDHFIPWSFVSHDLMWNLCPINKSINSSKRNRLPNLDMYLLKFVTVQRTAINQVYNNNPNNKLLEDYNRLGYSIRELLDMDIEPFYEIFKRTMVPLISTAERMGYESWK